MALVKDIIKRGTRAAQPAATTLGPGTLYFVTDENVCERVNDAGAAWETAMAGVAGAWADFPHASVTFGAHVGTWTVDAADVALYRYQLVGKTMTVSFRFLTTALSSTPLFILFTIPGGKLGKSNAVGHCMIQQGATYTSGLIFTLAADANFYIQRNHDATLAFTAGALEVAATFSFEVQ
jgi:hypothetical protein